MGSDKVIVSEIIQNTESYETPIILNFENGKLNSKNLDKKEFTSVYDTEKKKHSAILAANGNIYHGLIESSSKNQVDTYIAIKNKQTNKVRFIQTDQVLMSHNIHKQKNEILLNKFNEKLALTQLIKNFGGRKAGRYLERVQRMKVNVDSIRGQLEKTVEEYSVENDVLTMNSGVDDIVPPFNQSATSIKEIYTLNEIISQSLLDRLNEEVNEILASEEDLPISSEYILKEILNIKKLTSKTSPQNMTKIKVLLYMDGLMALIKTKKRDLTKTNLSNITEKIENDIRLNFSPKGSTKPIRTPYSSDKAFCYFIVLGMLINPKYEIDLNVLMQELSQPRQKTLQYANFVNAKLKSGGNILSLRLPETVKKMVRNRKRRTF